MYFLAEWAARKFAPGHENPANLPARTRLGLLEGWVSIVANTLLAVGKMALGLVFGSLSLLADAAHTFTDSASSLVVLIGFRLSGKPPDREHPYGHGRIESVVAVVVAVLLGVTAVETARASIGRILEPRCVDVSIPVIGLVAATMIVKEVLARFSFGLGRLIDSDALHADAWHHRSDVLSTGLVVAALLGARWGALWLDGAAGLGVSVLIALTALSTLRASAGPLIGQHLPQAVYKEITQIARSVDGVESVHDVVVQRFGALHVTSLHVVVPHNLSAMEAHEICERVEEKVTARFPGHATVHADPINRDHPHYARIREIVVSVTAHYRSCFAFHDLRILGGIRRFRVLLDISPEVPLSSGRITECRREIARAVRAAYPGTVVSVNVDPYFLRSDSDTDASGSSDQ
jgi:cation diffusion facilitator family transporter